MSGFGVITSDDWICQLAICVNAAWWFNMIRHTFDGPLWSFIQLIAHHGYTTILWLNTVRHPFNDSTGWDTHLMLQYEVQYDKTSIRWLNMTHLKVKDLDWFFDRESNGSFIKILEAFSYIWIGVLAGCSILKLYK